MITFIQSLYFFLIGKTQFVNSYNKNSRNDTLFLTLILCFVLNLIILIIFKYTDQLFGLPPHNSYFFVKNNKWYTIVILTLILGPVIEEITFRLFLKYSNLNLSISIGGFCYFLISLITKTKFYSLESSTLMKVVTSIIISFLIYILIEKKNKDFLLRAFWKRNQLKIIYFSIFIFGLIHLYNIKNLDTKTMLLFPILISPQLIIGLLSSYLRLNCGFYYAIIFHSLVNFFPALILLLVKFYS